MNPSGRHVLLKLPAALLAVLLLAALLTPAFFFAGKHFALAVDGIFRSAPWRGWIEEMRKAPLERYFNRAVMVSTLILIWPIARWLRIGGWRTLGLVSTEGRGWRQVSLGFILAAGGLLMCGLFYVHTGWVSLREPALWFALGVPFITGLIVASLEEWLFRGIILGLMLRSVRCWPAQLFTAAFFAMVHFLKPPAGLSIPDDQVTWGSGFAILGSIVGHLGQIQTLLAEFCTLFAVGLVLGHCRVRTRALWLSIGLHAGWVFGVKYFGNLTINGPDLIEGHWMPWAGENLRTGLIPLGVVLLTWGMVWIADLKGHREKAGEAN